MTLFVSLLWGAVIALVVACIGHWVESRGTPRAKAYPTLYELVGSIFLWFLAAQTISSIVLSVKLFAVGDMAIIFIATITSLAIFKKPAEYFIRWLLLIKTDVQ